MHDKRLLGGIAVALVLVLAFWLLFVRTPNRTKTPSTEPSGRALTPTYPREETTSTVATTQSSIANDGVSTTDSSVDTTATTVPEPTTQASVTDPVGDLTFSPDPPPPWADLAGAALTRSTAGYELRVKLGGGTAPATTDSNHTMNIASFYDVDGDGVVDYEVWANLADSGWGASWFDDRSGRTGFFDNSGVTIEVAGDALVLRFPLDHLGSAQSFRWSLASEWGSYAVIGSNLAARDDAPDNDQPATFPS